MVCFQRAIGFAHRKLRVNSISIVLILFALVFSACKPYSRVEDNANMVDERFELMALVWRLAGRAEYSYTSTEYQREVAKKFEEYKEHPAVKYTNDLLSYTGYDAVFKFAVHTVKNENGFEFIPDITSLFDGRWTEETATEFLVLLNDFYLETNFASFYEDHLPIYIKETENFIARTYSSVDMEWFRKYVDPDNLRCIYSLSSGNYGATVNDTIVYCCVMGSGESIVHEYCHSFANPIAIKWYEENDLFRQWCDDTVNLDIMPSYNHGGAIAREYVTRAYTIRYQVEHKQQLQPLFQNERNKRFHYIEDVYALVLAYDEDG